MNNNRFFPLAAAVVLAAIFLLTNCSGVGPDYVKPDTAMPGQFTDQPGGQALTEADRQALAHWWTLFGDPTLTNLVERALAGNLDLKQAEARVKEVRAQRRASRGNLYPSGAASGGGSVTRSRDQLGEWANRESYDTGLDVSWEADLFGGTRREMEADRADYEAAREDYRDIMVSLTAETATAYVNLRTFQKQLETARENLRLQAETLELARIKFSTGLAGSLDVDQATYSYESTRSQIPALEANVEEAKNRLAVLLGGWPGDLNDILSAPSTIPKGPLKQALGVPADLLRRRPDIRGAERNLAAQTARIGAAKADLYPKLTLQGSLGWNALALSGLISPANLAAVLGGAITWNIFNQEAVRANIEIQNARQEQALLEYEAAIRTAVEEVDNALVALAKETQKQEALTKAVEASKQAATLARQGYEYGLTDFQRVLDTQQSYLSFQTNLAQSYGQSALNLIVMYRALGGGWEGNAEW